MLVNTSWQPGARTPCGNVRAVRGDVWLHEKKKTEYKKHQTQYKQMRLAGYFASIYDLILLEDECKWVKTTVFHDPLSVTV